MADLVNEDRFKAEIEPLFTTKSRSALVPT